MRCHPVAVCCSGAQPFIQTCGESFFGQQCDSLCLESCSKVVRSVMVHSAGGSLEIRPTNLASGGRPTARRSLFRVFLQRNCRPMESPGRYRLSVSPDPPDSCESRIWPFICLLHIYTRFGDQFIAPSSSRVQSSRLLRLLPLTGTRFQAVVSYPKQFTRGWCCGAIGNSTRRAVPRRSARDLTPSLSFFSSSFRGTCTKVITYWLFVPWLVPLHAHEESGLSDLSNLDAHAYNHRAGGSPSRSEPRCRFKEPISPHWEGACLLRTLAPPISVPRHLPGTSLFEKREALEKKECTVEDVKALEDDSIKHVIKLQQEIGIKGITDGELRREVFFENVFDRLEGMTLIPDRPISTFKPYIPHIAIMYMMGIQEAETYYCTGKIKRTRSWYVDEFTYTKSLVAPEDVKNIKITMCSPSWYHQRHGSDLTYDLSVYKNDEEYFDDLGVAYRAEIQELYDLGCRNIQFDDPTFCYFCNDDMISGMEKSGVDHEALLDTYIRAINVCTQGRPEDLNVSVHMCRGNFKGGVHFTEGGYARIAVKVFNTLDIDTFYLEYDTERSGDFEPLKYFPLGKVAVLGLVTTKSPKLESEEEIKGRVNEAAEIMSKGNPKRSKAEALNQLCISTQCGFASVWQGNPLTEEDERKKLELLVKVSKEVWED